MVYYGQYVGGRSADTLMKPTGVPILKSSAVDPRVASMLYCAFDTGLGYYALLKDCSPGHQIFPPALYSAGGVGGTNNNPVGSPPTVFTPSYGYGQQWPGAVAESSQSVGTTTFVFDSDLIRDSQNLYAAGAGAGVTIGTWWIQDVVNVNIPVLFGRSARGFTEGAPYASYLLSMDGGQKCKGWYYTDGAGAASSLISGDLSLGVLHSSFLRTVNNTSGSATVSLIIDGVVVASASGVALRDTFGSENNEGQIMLGSNWHVYANHVSNVLFGKMYMGIQWARGLSDAECLSLSPVVGAPWSMFQ